MSEHETMKVGPLELRKSDEGWQYQSEGIEGEPGTWCDATDVLGPFGGSGVNDLLDELWAAKEQISQGANNVCKNCRHWGQMYTGCCDFIDTIQGGRVAATSGCEIIASATDDSGLQASLRTGPNFSCPNFSKKLRRGAQASA